MIDFIQNHDNVLSSLISLDFKNKVIYFGDDSKAVFERKQSKKTEAWVGPADPLVLKRITRK